MMVLAVAALWSLMAFTMVMVAMVCVLYAFLTLLRADRGERRGIWKSEAAKFDLNEWRREQRAKPDPVWESSSTVTHPVDEVDIRPPLDPSLAHAASRFGGGMGGPAKAPKNGVVVDAATLAGEAWEDMPGNGV